MKYYDDIRELIGHTPIVKLNRSGFQDNINVFAKLELYNPGGSVKDRMGAALIKDAEEKGLLSPGSTIIEATSGNAGIGIALAALGKDYRVIFVVPIKDSVEKQAIMHAYGAEIINTTSDLQGSFEKVNELLSTIDGAVNLNQFTNPVNPQVHYETTGHEIYNDLDGKIDYVVGGAGSGGTICGVLKYLKEINPSIKGVLADPIGSILGGGEAGYFDIEGIGNKFIPQNMDLSLIDEFIKVSDSDAANEIRLLAQREGILAGPSSGAALSAARKFLQKIKDGNIVVILPDRGDRYLSKNLFSD